MRTRLMATIGAGVLALAFAGCGGADTTSAPADSGVTKAQYIEQGDTLCGQLNGALGKEIEKAGKGASDPKFIEDTVVPGVQAQIDGVRSLTPPAGDEETVTAMLDDSQDALDAGAKDAPESLLLDTSDDKSPFYDVSEALGEYGFKVCAQPAPSS